MKSRPVKVLLIILSQMFAIYLADLIEKQLFNNEARAMFLVKQALPALFVVNTLLFLGVIWHSDWFARDYLGFISRILLSIIVAGAAWFGLDMVIILRHGMGL